MVAMHPTKLKSFSTSTVHTTAAENVEPAAREVGMLGGLTRVCKSVGDRELEAPPTRLKNECKNLGRHLELSKVGSGW